MALSDSDIRAALKDGGLVIEPFDDASLNPAGYDLRLAGAVVLEPGAHQLGRTLERVVLSS